MGMPNCSRYFATVLRAMGIPSWLRSLPKSVSERGARLSSFSINCRRRSLVLRDETASPSLPVVPSLKKNLSG